MLIKEDKVIPSGVRLNRIHSDRFVYIKRVGTDIIVPEAVEVDGSEVEYEETDIPIEPIEASEEDMINALTKLGV